MKVIHSILLVDFVIPLEDVNQNSSNNTRRGESDSASESRFQLFKLITTFAPLVISFVNFVFNFLSLVVFSKWKRRPIVTLLVFLSISETAFNLGLFAMYGTFYISDVETHSIPSINGILAVVLYAFVHPVSVLLANSCVLIRNWSVALIAFARFEAIKYPLKPKKICEGKSLNAILFTITAICLIYGFVRIFESRVIVSSETNKIINYNPILISNEYYNMIYLNVGFLVLQGGGPIISVFWLSFALIYQLHVASQSSARMASNNRYQNANSTGKVQAKGKDKDESADRYLFSLLALYFSARFLLWIFNDN